MRTLEESLTQFAQGALDEDDLVTQLATALQNRPAEDLVAAIDSVATEQLPTETRDRLLARLNAQPAQVAHPGMIIRDRFVLEKEIGRGGMGVVYEARDLRREEADDRFNKVAIKVMNKELQHHPHALVTLQREARRAQQLAHPNIATVFDFDRADDFAYLCMELLVGQPLNAVLRDGEERSMSFSLSIIYQLCDGLAYAHKRGVVHADLKPGNIFLTRANVVKILDFGLARTVRNTDDSTAPKSEFDAGRWQAMTPAYASPEMFEQEQPDPRDDIYALACVSYELLAADHPFQRLAAPKAQKAGMVAEPIRGLTRRQNKALQDALAFDRTARTPTVEAFREGLIDESKTGPTLTVTVLAIAAIAAVLGLSGLFVNTNRWFETPTEATPSGGTRTEAQEPTASTDSETVDAEPTDTAPDPEQDIAEVEIDPRPVVTLDQATQQRLERILEMADLHFAMGRIVSPQGSNAVEAYLAVVATDPSNEQATRGLNRVMDSVTAQAQGMVQAGDHGAAIELVETARQHMPDNPKLRALDRELRNL